MAGLPNILFKGIPRSPTRGYTVSVIQTLRPRRVVIPCTGSFSLAWISKEAGVAPQDIVAGDISLYSTALGNAIMDKDWRLELREGHGHDALASAIAGDVEGSPDAKAAAVLFSIRYLQFVKKTDKQYYADFRRELLYNAEAYLAQLKVQVGELADELHGLMYLAQDMWVTLDDAKDDPHTLILANPPRYNGGYERMFRGMEALFDWDEPPYQMFKEQDYSRLMELLGFAPATTLMYYATPEEDPTELWGEPWRSVFADRPGSKRHAATNWIIANRSPVDHTINRERLGNDAQRFPLFTAKVTSESVLWAEKLDKDTGNYYRDLFIHRLAGGGAEHYIGLFLDGSLFAVAGIHLRAFHLAQGGGDAGLVFAFTVPHPTYARLHKLTLISLLSSWLWRDIRLAGEDGGLRGRPEYLSSSMLTPHPENKTARGTGMKMVGRERTGNEYKLRYRGRIEERTREETLEQWLRKYGEPETPPR